MRIREGLYHCKVLNNNDPEKRHRYRLYIPEIHPEGVDEKHLPWCDICIPTAHHLDAGDWIPAQEGDWGWCMFNMGDINRPVWMGGWYGMPGQVPESPRRRLQRSATQAPGNPGSGTKAPSVDGGDPLITKVGSADRQYARYEPISTDSKIYRSPKGHYFEFVDDREYIRLIDFRGNELELDTKNKVVTLKDNYGQAIWFDGRDRSKNVKAGFLREEYKSDVVRRIKGSYGNGQGAWSHGVTGNFNRLVGGNYKLNSGGSTVITSGGNLAATAGQMLLLTGLGGVAQLDEVAGIVLLGVTQPTPKFPVNNLPACLWCGGPHALQFKVLV